MPKPIVLRTLVRELLTSERAPRVTEPDLVMDDPAKAAAFNEAGGPRGVMAPVYLFHASQACDVIRAGDRVVDLGCGPANQLAIVARLNPDARFLGVDLSPPMLERAREHVASEGLGNVEFRESDVADLASLPDASVDVVMSTMALHHLPTVEHLQSTLEGACRVLKPGGGLYITDFGHLKSERSIESFAHEYADRQPELFTLDYLYSLRAAFPVHEFRKAGACLLQRARLYTTFVAPYMIAFKSPPRGGPDSARTAALREMRASLPRFQQADFRDLTTFFGLGGMRSQCLHQGL